MQHENRRFSDEELRTAKETDLPELLASLGYTVKRIGSYYTTKEMDSLRIKDRRTWFRYSEQQGGDAIDFVERFCGKSFPEAVNFLLDYHGGARYPRAPPIVPPKEKKPFSLPPPNVDNRRVTAYLRKRGIAAQVIENFIKAGLLYEDAEHHNCVFVGRNQSGKPVFAAKRGTYDLGGAAFRGREPGSEKEIGFRLPASPDSLRLFVFEAPIDLMSYCTLHRRVKTNAVALCCLYHGPIDTYLRENPHGSSTMRFGFFTSADIGETPCNARQPVSFRAFPQKRTYAKRAKNFDCYLSRRAFCIGCRCFSTRKQTEH